MSFMLMRLCIVIFFFFFFFWGGGGGVAGVFCFVFSLHDYFKLSICIYMYSETRYNEIFGTGRLCVLYQILLYQ